VKKNRVQLIIYLLFLPVFLNADGFGECEKGDLIFRTGVVYYGHTGIYCDWDESGKPSD